MNTDNIYSLEWTANIRPLGRVFVYNGVLWMSFSASGIEFECEGGFTAELTGDDRASDTVSEDAAVHYARFAVFEDGRIVLDERLDCPGKTIKIKAEGKHVFRLIKLSESDDSSLGIKSLTPLGGGSGSPVPTAAKALKIEFVGDSITCGYGVEGSLAEAYTTASENAALAWAYLTADRLGADYSIVSKSGAGIISGYTGDGVKNTANILTGYYERMGCSSGSISSGVKPQDFEYDFSFEPDMVIINLGTNDVSYCHPLPENGSIHIEEEEERSRRAEFYTEYKNFVRRVRELNPSAKIVCMLGIMTEELNGEVGSVVRELNAEGDADVYWLALMDQDPADGYGTDYHPTGITQMKLADRVTDYVRQLLK